MRFLVIGESCLDVFVYGGVSRIAPEAPVPVLVKESMTKNAGMASNVASNLTSLGCHVTLHTNTNWQTIKKTRFVESKCNHMFMRLDENDEEYGSCDLSAVNIESYDCVIISDYNKGWLTSDQIREIGMRSKLCFLDTKKILGKWAETVTFIKINENEYERTRDVLSDAVDEKLIITLGPRGASHKGVIYPCPTVQRVDSAGAGDTFVSGLAKMYCETSDIARSIEFANECASVVVQKKGVSTIK